MIHARYIITQDGLDAMVSVPSRADCVARQVQGASLWLLQPRVLPQPGPAPRGLERQAERGFRQAVLPLLQGDLQPSQGV